MDSVIDMADGSKALDLSRIRFQLMSVCPSDPWVTGILTTATDAWKIPLPSTSSSECNLR